jgi:hypothetical protein
LSPAILPQPPLLILIESDAGMAHGDYDYDYDYEQESLSSGL